MRRYHIQDREDYHKCDALSAPSPEDPYPSRMEAQLLSKLYDMGLSDVDKLTVAAFCRRRLAVRMEDFVTWVDTSKLKRTIMSYNDELDDYDLL
ncbi:hypothetical protein CPB85DRAFT_1342335 [Mucidula mucida]|nr:hypothetical protein CPB85DRAFT_1342335 [Mucidula mucida]